MSNEIDSTESASQPEEAVASALNEKVEALTRSVEALMAAQTPTPEPEQKVEAAESQLDVLARSMEKLTALMIEREESAPEPVVEEDPEKVQLRARLDAMEKKMSRMAAKPVRRAAGNRFRDEVRTSDTHPDAKTIALLDEKMGASALATVARDFESVIYYDKRIHGRDKLPQREDLTSALRAVLMAASVDGLIDNPDFT